MNSVACAPPVPPFAAPLPARPRRASRWRWLFLSLGAFASLVVVLVVALALSFRVGAETRDLRRTVVAAAPGDWKTDFELGVGRLPAFLARHGLHLASSHLKLPPEALVGIDAFRSADVGVYHRRPTPVHSGHSTSFGSVDDVMAARGWESVVSVQERDQTVRIFVPSRMDAARDLRACVLVLDKEQLVVVSARLDPEPLIGLAQARLPDCFR